jgi:glycosyltransferase involved in cell wall biosynthesis
VRIARILTRLNLGGPARQVLASDPLLVERGHVVRILAGRPSAGEGDLFEVFRERGLDVVRVPGLARGLSPLADLRALTVLKRELAEFAPDVVHTHASKAGVLGRRSARGLGVPRVHTFHGHVLEGYFPETLSRWIIGLERRLASETDRVVAVSHATADDLTRLGVVPEEKLVVVPPGIELEPFLALEPRPAGRHGALRELLGAQQDDVVVGVVGRLAEVKRPELAVDVFATLAARFPKLQLVFIGDGDRRGGLERQIAGLGELAPRVHMVGAVPDMPPVMADLDIVLLTSRTEGLPIALIEAAASGLPVVATDVGGVSELVAHERTGFLGATADELAYGLAQLLEDPDGRQAMGHRARLRVATRHAAASLANRLEALYEALVSGSQGGRVPPEREGACGS